MKSGGYLYVCVAKLVCYWMFVCAIVHVYISTYVCVCTGMHLYIFIHISADGKRWDEGKQCEKGRLGEGGLKWIVTIFFFSFKLYGR